MSDKTRRALQKILARRPEAAALLTEAEIDLDALEALALARGVDGAEAASSRSAPASALAPAPAPPSALAAAPRSIVALTESIIEEAGRPTLFVSGDDFDLPADEALARRLRAARAVLRAHLPSIGLVEAFDGSMKWPIGTAWMIAENIAITNRHVAEKFATTDAAGAPVLLSDLRGRPYKVTIDFREEHGSVEESEALVESVIYLPRRSREISDVALLRMASGRSLPPPIPLHAGPTPVDSWIAVVGYPQPDDRIPPEAREIEENYFSNIYGVKRLSPGQIDDVGFPGAPEWLLAHDATTLGGNSGSVLLDLASGAAVGLHFMGEFRKANYAVHSGEIRRVLDALGVVGAHIAPTTPKTDDESLIGEEAAGENLDAFSGYAPDFIDAAINVPLPVVTDQAPGSVALRRDGGAELRYRNFSVVMNTDRRLCFFSAVNIDGDRTFSINGQRPGWRTDRRLDEAFQIIRECYGAEQQGKFSRGHMTRREDPNWGENREEAVVSNRHTFYVTNACPQVQPFNAGIWNQLEDYALENCDQDDMRISVFTGPVFRPDDPDYFGVKIPIEFWKIIAFKHDQTGSPVATGYIMSQRNVMPTDEEFVFGQFMNSQVTIRHIERLTGLSFYQLHDHDPLDDGTESVAVSRLRTLSDIRFA